MTLLPNYPDFWLIHWINEAATLFGYTVDMYERELESRQPHFEPEYDATGQIIISEVMGYDDEGGEIWS